MTILNGRDTETGIQVVWNSTSLGELKVCPRKYQYSILQGWTSKHQSIALRFGLEYQSALELHDRLLAEGIDYDIALAQVVRATLERTWERSANIDGRRDTISEGIESAQGSVTGAGQEADGHEADAGAAGSGRPWGGDSDTAEPNRNRETLIRSIVWKLEHFRDDPAKTVILASGKPAVELSFQMEAPFRPATPSAPNYIFSGHLDRVVEFAGEMFVADNKTTGKTLSSQYFRQYEPDNQMSLYTVAAQTVFKSPVKGIMIDAAQIAVGFTRFERGFTYRTTAQLEEWLNDAEYWIGQAETFTINQYFPMNDKSCFLCQFKTICSKDPAVRETFLKSDFIQRIRDPLEIRG